MVWTWITRRFVAGLWKRACGGGGINAGRTGRSGEDYHTPVPSGVPLADVFAFEETRTVNNDFTIRHQNRWYQLSGKGKSLPPAKSSVTVRLRLDGSMRVLYRGNAVVFTGIPMPVRKPSGPTATAATGRSRITQAWKYG